MGSLSALLNNSRRGPIQSGGRLVPGALHVPPGRAPRLRTRLCPEEICEVAR